MNPACQISYSRTALVLGTNAGLIRLTLDEDLRAWRVRQPEYVPVAGGAGLLKEQAILELKFRLVMPALFQEMLEEFGLSRQAVSKYHLAVNRLGCAPAVSREMNVRQGEAVHA
jgi:hypothetical protein